MFSKTCEYAIRAVIFLAGLGSGKKAGIEEISAAIDTPRHFTAKILQSLAKQKVISSVKGPHGGFFIKSKKLSVLHIVTAIEGPDFFDKCNLGLKNCSDKKPCPLHFALKEKRESLKRILKEKTIHQLAQETEEKKLRLHN